MSNHTQLKTVFEYLQNNVTTASMVSEATGVPQKNVCRYKRTLERLGKLAVVKRDVCQKTGYIAWYITTDRAKFPAKVVQLGIFEQP